MNEEKHPRIGVYICHCGGNISDYVDVKKVADEIGKERDVVIAKDVMFACSDSSQSEMIQDVKKNKLDRVIVASCSPRLHEVTFRNVTQRAGLNPYTYYHVNIREQSSWAHTDDREGATRKALRQVRSAVGYSRLSEPLEGIRASSTPSVMIVGGGIAGLRAAIDLANAGISVHLIEREPSVGGRVPQLSKLSLSAGTGLEIINKLVHEVQLRENVAVYTNSELVSLQGYVGNFEATISTKGNTDSSSESVRIKVASIIVATGFDPYEPKIGEFGYGLYRNVITLQQLHKTIEDGTLENVHNIAFIYCVGSRQTPTSENQDPNTYCSRYCCNATMNVSLSLLQKRKDLHLYHLHRDIRTYGLNETLYEKASRDGVVFLKYSDETPPTVTEKNGKLHVKLKDLLTPIDEELELSVDLVVLVTGMTPRKDNDHLYGMLKISKGKDHFLLEIHPKLKPVETAIAGVYIAGTAQAPRDIKETLASAEAAAAKAANIALKKELVLEPYVAQVNSGTCSLNKECIQECKYDAIEIREDAGLRKAWVNAARCTGCGACVAVCPTGAIELKGLANEQIKAMIQAMGRRN
ncbi:MAG TPA: CoB--CoM heterodisulfide reductase iron-sulfur subunit A family protein [Terriglobales bacterium]|nr:CoB--CoM heterodisulfide reductase iron-sulfur subunit A family protein [Terriglobales bacterium]